MKKTFILSLAACLGLVVIFFFAFWSIKQEVQQVTDQKSGAITPTPDIDQTPEKAPVFFSTMSHYEKSWKEAATDRDYFMQLVEQTHFAMDLAEKYEAILTFESETPFAEGMVRFDENVFAEALARGHGVGTHCDIPSGVRYTIQELVLELKKRKQLIDRLVGAENNLGCSGVAGAQEWYEPMVQAGFDYLDGLVGGHYISMPLSERPEGWTDEEILDGEYWHATAPQDPDQRYYPFWVNSDDDFKEDEDGDLLISAGDLGGNLITFAEADPVTGVSVSAKAECKGVCPLTNEDVDELIKRVNDFLSTRDETRVAKLQVYLPPGIFVEENETVLRYFFSELQELQERGEIKWGSQLEVYEAVVEWNGR